MEDPTNAVETVKSESPFYFDTACARENITPMRKHRARLESVAAVATGKLTVGDAVRGYLEKIRASASLKPRSKDYREMIMDFIDRSWPAATRLYP